MPFRNTLSLRKRRELARRDGVCITCFKEAPAAGRSVCGACSAAAKQRVYQARSRRRLQSEDDRIAGIFEATGDEAGHRYAYDDACRFYEAASSKVAPAHPAWGRLAEKIAEALYRTDVPQAAMPWFEKALQFHQTISRDASKVAQIKLRLARQYWLDARTASALPVIESAINTALQEPQDPGLLVRARIAMAHYLVLLARFQEASPYLLEVSDEAAATFPETHVIFLAQQAILAASNGEKDTSFEFFERAVAAATVFSDGYLLTSVLDDYGLWSLALGDIETARRCRERALLVAHEQNITWRIAYLSLRYADLLVLTGEWDRAGDLITNASKHALDTPIIRLLLLGSALPLALETQDRRLQQLSYDERLIEVAFRSGEDARIASAASAIASFYVHEGRIEDAAASLARGVRSVRHADHCWAMLVEAAAYCSDIDAARARALLATRAVLPNNAVTQACLNLFDGCRAVRAGDADPATFAESASRQFEALGWSMYAQRAKSLIAPKKSPVPQDTSQAKKQPERLIGDLGSNLTPREHEIAELVLKGLTNRAIAMHLHISENTVETHMSSILTRLGIHSRWQISMSP